MIIAIISSIITFAILALALKSKLRSIKSVFYISFIICYVVNIMITNLYSEYLEYALKSFDLDGDTVFSIAEETQKQREAMDALTNDAGRSLVWLLGLFYSLIFSLIIMILYKLKQQ